MLSNSTKNSILRALCGKTANLSLASSCYLGLSFVEPQADGSGAVEPMGNGYVRKFIGNYQTSASQLMGDPANGVITNSQEIHFDESTGAWVSGQGATELVYACIYSQVTGGSALAWGELGTYSGGQFTPTPLEVGANEIVVIKVGQINISITDEE